MKIVLLEHLTSFAGPVGGGRADASQRQLRAEGAAMRDALAEDLIRLGDVQLVLLHRPEIAITAGLRRLLRCAPPGSLDLVPVGGRREEVFRRALRRADAGLIIAPEEEDLLPRLSRIVEEEGRILLGPSPGAARLAGDKLASARLLASASLPTPATEAIPFATAARRLSTWPLPVVLKPRDGCGGQGVRLLRRRGGIARALAAVRRATSRPDLLVQDYVPGEDASVSLLVSAPASSGPGAGARSAPAVLPLGLSRQEIRLGAACAYRGGAAPFRHPASRAASELAVAAVRALAAAAEGVRGYLGVDLVLARDGPSLIEINPRPTTSYVGLRRLFRENLAGLLRDAALGRSLPARLEARGLCRFRGDGTVRFSARDEGDAQRGGKPGWESTSAGTSAASI